MTFWSRLPHLPFAVLEFFPIVLSLHIWGDFLMNKHILFFSDNDAVVQVINKQSCRDKSLMFFVRKLVAICLRLNIVFKAKHIPGINNTLADSLSRLQVQTFKNLAPPHMDPLPTPIPEHLLPLNWQIRWPSSLPPVCNPPPCPPIAGHGLSSIIPRSRRWNCLFRFPIQF